MPKTNQVSLRKRIVDDQKAGDGHTKLSQGFQVSRTGERSITKKLKESHTVQNEHGRGREKNISKTLERILAREKWQITPEHLPRHE